MQTPQLDYGLGGIGSFGDVPGISSLVRSVVMDKVRSRFVWPNKFKLLLPLQELSGASLSLEESRATAKWFYMLPRPAGLLEVELKGARHLMKKDKHFGGSGLSDPYAIVAVGERKMNFRNQYAPKTVDPVWNYQTKFLMDNPTGEISVFQFAFYNPL